MVFEIRKKKNMSRFLPIESHLAFERLCILIHTYCYLWQSVFEGGDTYSQLAGVPVEIRVQLWALQKPCLEERRGLYSMTALLQIVQTLKSSPLYIGRHVQKVTYTRTCKHKNSLRTTAFTIILTPHSSGSLPQTPITLFIANM